MKDREKNSCNNNNNFSKISMLTAKVTLEF